MSTRAFEDLTQSGQTRRLRGLALEALRSYDLEVERCSFVARAFNTVFRVDVANGSTYALRMSPSLRIHAAGCEEAEADWVAALRRDAGLNSPQVIRAQDGSVVVSVTAAGVPGVRTCVLFEWVRGHRLRDSWTTPLVGKTGELTAVVHEHAAAHQAESAPAGVLVADHVLYFLAERRLEELRPVYGSALDDAVDRAQQTVDELWRHQRHPPHLLHGDIQPGNVMADRDDVVLIDFQDLIWGFELQDLAMTQLAFDQIDASGALSAAFRAGYETRRAWPETDAETVAALRAARHLNILNFGLKNVRGHGFDEFVRRHAVPVAEWMAD